MLPGFAWSPRAAAQQGVAVARQQLRSIDLGCRLAAQWFGRVGSGQCCCWPLNGDPSGGAAMASGVRIRLEILAALTVLLSAGWAAAGLVFRYSTYGAMPVAPGEPYGEADVLELVHYAVLLVLAGLVVLQGLFLLFFERFRLRPLAAFMCLFGLALPFVYRPLHSWVASLAVG
jgi:hypothetical protein